MARVFGALFFDKFRAFATLAILLIIAGLLAMNHFFPKPVKLDEKTTESFVLAADVMRKAASTMEGVAQDNVQFRASMKAELESQAELRKSNYAALYEQYGDGSPELIGPTGAKPDYSLQPPANFERGGPVPPSQSDPGPIQQLQHPTSHSGKTTGGSTPGASGGSSSSPSVKGGAVSDIPGKQ